MDNKNRGNKNTGHIKVLRIPRYLSSLTLMTFMIVTPPTFAHDIGAKTKEIEGQITALEKSLSDLEQHGIANTKLVETINSIVNKMENLSPSTEQQKTFSSIIKITDYLEKNKLDAKSPSQRDKIKKLIQALGKSLPAREQIISLNKHEGWKNNKTDFNVSSELILNEQTIVKLSKPDKDYAIATRGLALNLLRILRSDLAGSGEVLEGLLHEIKTLLTEDSNEGLIRNALLKHQYKKGSKEFTNMQMRIDEISENWNAVIAEKPVPIITHIVSAYAGDLSSSRNSNYQCNVTKKLRVKCWGFEDGTCGTFTAVKNHPKLIDYTHFVGKILTKDMLTKIADFLFSMPAFPKTTIPHELCRIIFV